MSNTVKSTILLLFAAACLSAQTSDENRMYAMLQTGIDAFNARDAVQFANLYADNAEFITPDGHILHGKEQIRAAHEALFTMIPKAEKSTTEYVERKMTMLSADMALLTARWKSTDIIGGQPNVQEMSFSLLAKQINGQWLGVLTTLTPVVPFTGSGK
ncbi:MAG: YybH family protein [Saprospiraceae bacterium]